MSSTIISTKAETSQKEEDHSPSSFLIGIIVVSVFVVLGLLVVTYLLVRRMRIKKNNRHEIETTSTSTQITDESTPALTKATTTTTTAKYEKNSTSVAPITSSLDTNEIFFSILEHPPKPPPPIVRNNVDHRLSSVMFEEGYCLNPNFTDINSLHSDPISASLARQREDRRMSYYITPSLSQTKLNEEKRLSVSSYQVW